MHVHNDALSHLAATPDNTYHAMVTDPPYGMNIVPRVNWDGDVPGVDIWAEALRACRPGAWAAVFGSTRTWHHTATALEAAGWEIRDTVMWLHGAGFPGGNPLRNVDGGLGNRLRPMWEPVILVTKPRQGTYVNNVAKWGCGGLNIDACRIPTDETWERHCNDTPSTSISNGYRPHTSRSHPAGRYPGNVVLDADAATVLDAVAPNVGGLGGGKGSRLFWTGKACRSEREAGCEALPAGAAGRHNHHPTVKPLELMRYLVRLTVPVGGHVVDPFGGTGTTGIAAGLEGRRWTCVEMNAEFIDIARARTAHHHPDT